MILAAAFTAFAICTSGANAAAPRGPNILLILCDDVGYSDYGCFGSEIATPHIDSLARDGLTFTRFYNNAVCVPTRASLVSGLYPRYIPKDIRLTPEMPTVAEALRSAGYRTSLSGKWHLGRTAPNHPLDRGFEVYYGLLDGCSNHHDPSMRDPAFEGGRLRNWSDGRTQLTSFPPDFYSTDAITDHALAQMRRFKAEGDAPFFVHVCFTAAHSPLHAKPADIAKYAGKYTSGWDALREVRRLRQLKLGLTDPAWTVSPREPEFKAWEDEPLKEWNANLMTVYAAMVDSIDQNIGRLLKALDELQVAEDTIVIVLNDNGGCAEQAGGDDPTNIAGPREHYVSCGPGWGYAQNTPFRRYKAWTHEGGISTPCLVRWPKVVKPGTSTRAVGHVIDWMPTLLEAAGTAAPRERNRLQAPPLEGISLMPILRGREPGERGPLYWASLDNRAIRRGDWKLVWDQNIRRWELYNVVADRTEMHDRSTAEPQLARELETLWNAWAEQTGAVHKLGQKYTLIRVKP